MEIMIFITCPNKKEANSIAGALLKIKLAACVNIIKNIESIFRWEGKIDRAKEALLIIKSRKGLLGDIIKLVRTLHSYEVPEIIALPIIGGNTAYLEWLNESVRKSH